MRHFDCKFERVKLNLASLPYTSKNYYYSNNNDIVEITDDAGLILARVCTIEGIIFKKERGVKNLAELEHLCQEYDHNAENWIRHEYGSRREHKLIAALCRLSIPFGLSESHRDFFRGIILKHRNLAPRVLFENDLSEFLHQMPELLLTRINTEKFIEVARQSRKIDEIAFLLEYKSRNFKKDDLSSALEVKPDRKTIRKAVVPNSFKEIRKKWHLKGLTYPELILAGYKGSKGDKVTFPLSVDGKKITRAVIVYGNLPEEITIPEGYKSLFITYFHAKGIKKITLPNSLTNILIYGHKHGWGNTRPTNKRLFENFPLDDGVAYGRGGFTTSILEEITFGSQIKFIGDSFFQECDSLRNVVLPRKLKMIYSHAFQGCSSLETLDLGDRLEYIGSEAFANCINLKSIKIPPTIKSIAPDAFDNTGITSIELDIEFISKRGLYTELDQEMDHKTKSKHPLAETNDQTNYFI